MSLFTELKRRNVLDMDVLGSRSTWMCGSDQHVVLELALSHPTGIM